MRNKKLLIVLLLPILFLLPFSKNANAQIPDYVGVRAGEQYTWKAEVHFGNVDNLLDNVRSLLVDWKANLPTSFEFFGYESLTIAEIYEQMAVEYLDYILPVGWEGLNLSTLVKETFEHYIGIFNSSFLSGMIPSNWLTLNFSDFYYLAVDGINATLYPTGYENNPLPELFKMAINELNSDFLFDLIPSGWETMTIGELIETLMMENLPPLWESYAVQFMWDSTIAFSIPTEILDATPSDLFDQLVATFPPPYPSLNASALFDLIFYNTNASMPGIESESMANILNLLGDMVNQSLPIGYGELTTLALLEMGIDELMMMLPPELQGKTIIEILDYAYTQAISLFDSMIIPGWDTTYFQLQALGMASFEAGLRIDINSIGTERPVYLGGPMGVPMDMDYWVTLDPEFEDWLNVETQLGLTQSFSPILLFFYLTYYPYTTSLPDMQYIVDPSTYILPQTALADQAALTGALVLAKNYDWESIETEFTMMSSEVSDVIEISVEWNNKGVLKLAEFKTGGLVVAKLSLIEAEAEREILGFEIPIILGFTSIALIAIIFHLKRKNNIIK